MTEPRPSKRPTTSPAVASLDDELDRIGSMTIDELRGLWRQTRRQEPPAAFSRDVLARALAYHLQEDRLGGLPLRLRKLLASVAKSGSAPGRRLKIGSVIVRECQGTIHEVLIVPDGFCWRGETYSSLSAIAQKITGTKWNGPRFFGLRADENKTTPEEPAMAPATPLQPTRSREITNRLRGGSGRRGKEPA